MKAIISFHDPVQRSSGRFYIPISVLAAMGVVVAFWAATYLRILNYLGGGFSGRSELFEWSLVAVGALGLVGVVYLAWQDTRDPEWRAAHGLPRRPRSNSAGN